MITSVQRQRLALFAVLAAMSVAVVDAGVVNIALPAFSARFRLPEADATLVVSAYQVALLIGLLPSSHLAERVGARRLFVRGILLFSAASTACALAPTFPILVVARFAQGLGAAAIMALGVPLLRATLGEARLGNAVGWNALAVALCSAAGPPIGAILLAIAPWPTLFLVGIPIALAASLSSHCLEELPRTRQKIDLRGAALHAITIGLLFVGATLALRHAATASACAALGGAGLYCIALRSRSQAAPLFPFDLFRQRPFALQTCASICCFVGQSIGLIALSFQLQSGSTPGPLAAGAVIACWPLAVAVSSAAAQRTGSRLGTSEQCALGGLLMAAGLATAALTPVDSGMLLHAFGPSICGLGFGIFQLANNQALFAYPPIDRAATAGGVQGTARLTGQTAGTLMISTIFVMSPGNGPTIGLAAASLSGLAAALLSFVVARTAAQPMPCGQEAAA